MRRLLLLAALFAAAFGAPAQERVIDFHSDIRIAANGELTVTERITVQAEGREIRRGILRDFPTDYRDRFDSAVSVPFHVERVLRDGQPEPYALERLANGARVRIGRADVLLPHGEHTYELTYRTARQVGFFDAHDELYWNVNGNGWTLGFERISAEVRLPQSIAATLIRAEAYTGPQGAQGRSYRSFVRDGGAAFRATRSFQPREGMTIVVSFPKGIVTPPTRGQALQWWIRDNPAALIGAGGFLLLVAFLAWRWRLVGRDPRAGPRFPRYEAPPGLGPAGVRFVDRMSCDHRCFASALLGLGESGLLSIRQHDKAYEITRTDKAAGDWLPGEQALLQALLPEPGVQRRFGRTYDPIVGMARRGFEKALATHFGEKLFSRNRGSFLAGLIMGGATLGFMLTYDAPLSQLLAVAAAMGIALVLFYHWLPAYSAQGRRMQDAIEGLRQYLSVAEIDELSRLKAPPQTPDEFAKFLPYAVALGLEKTWAERFTQILGAAAVTAAVSDYYSTDAGGGLFDRDGMGAFSSGLSGLGDTVSAASTPPGSRSGSSGSRGGGSSGGGGGGGGGSGW
jgi:hypothetical protein